MTETLLYASRDLNANRCAKRFPGPEKGTRCYFDKMPGTEVCAGHRGGDTFDVSDHNADVPELKPEPKKRQPRKVKPVRKPRRMHR